MPRRAIRRASRRSRGGFRIAFVLRCCFSAAAGLFREGEIEERAELLMVANEQYNEVANFVFSKRILKEPEYLNASGV